MKTPITKKLFFTFILFISLFISQRAFAGVFPDNAKTNINTVAGGGNTIVVNTTTPKTILGVQIVQQNTASDTIVRCGTENVVFNYATTLPMFFLSYVCNGTINIQKTGNDTAHTIITWVDYDLTGGYAGDIIMSTNFTSGELMISTLLFLILILILIYFLRSAINSVRVNRRFQGNNSPDGKEFYEL